MRPIRVWGALALLTGVCIPAHALGAQVVRVPRVWRLSIEAEGGYESNVRLQLDGPSDQRARINGQAMRTWTRPRGHVSLSGIGSVSRYRRSRDLNQFTYGAAGETAQRVTERLDMSASASYQTSVSSEISVNQGPGVTILPVSLSRSLSASTNLAYRLTPDLGGTLGASYSHVSFDTPGLVPGSTVDVRGALSRRSGIRSTLSLVGATQQGSSQGLSLTTQTLAGGWSTTSATGRFGASAQAGVTRSVAGGAATFGPTGSAELRTRVKQGLATLRYSRSVSQAFGLGRLLASDIVAVRYDRASFHGLAVQAGASRAWNGSTTPGVGRFLTTDGNLEIRHVFASGLTLGGGALYRLLEQGSGATSAVPGVKGTTVHVTMGYTLGGN